MFVQSGIVGINSAHVSHTIHYPKIEGGEFPNKSGEGTYFQIHQDEHLEVYMNGSSDPLVIKKADEIPAILRALTQAMSNS